MKRVIAVALSTVALCAAVLAAVPLVLEKTMPAYPSTLAADDAEEKITGMWLVEQGAKADNSLLIFGSSELKTSDIVTHPANFFAETGLQVDLVGRGSCQSIIHALAIGAQGETLQNQQIVLITAPQSYVAEGIASDLFMANYSQQQLLDILADDSIPAEIKTYLATRVQQLFDAYEADTGLTPEKGSAGDAVSAAWAAGQNPWYLAPYAALTRWMLHAKDLATSRSVVADYEDAAPVPLDLHFDYQKALDEAMAQAAEMVTNNDFTMQDSYYSTYIGARLDQMEGKDSDLSYSVSPEYDDLRCLLDLCALWDLDVLFVHVPMHGAWNDYVGFDKEKRAEYYDAVREIVETYDGVTLLDLTAMEYEPYFLCDTMHLGWKGWPPVAEAIEEFYRAD